MTEKRWRLLGLALASALVIPRVFQAAPDLHPPGYTITLAATTPSGSSTALHYHASVPAGERITPGDFFRVNDLPGYVAGSALAPSGWSASVERVSAATPIASVSRFDDPGVPNLLFTYVGPTPIAGPVLLQGFSAQSRSGAPRAVRGFVGRSTRASGPDAGTKVTSAGDVRGPGSVPEPASVLSACLGVIILGVVYAQRHRSMLLGSL